MTRLYTEADVRAMLGRAASGGASCGYSRASARLDGTINPGEADAIASRILSAATPATPSQPDLMAVAEAVREAAAEVAAFSTFRCADRIRSIDLAPIIAASGTGQGEASLPVLRHCGDCRYGHQVLGIRDHEHRPQGACMNDAMLPSPVESRMVDVYEGAPPPPWCPLRTPRKEQKR